MSEMVERVALAIEQTMFAQHELPLPAELHARYLATARAAITAMQAGWQPIETAPKDGTPVDLFTVSGRRWCDYRFDKEQRYPAWTLASTKDFDWQDRPIIPASSVTHWMPLPAPPVEVAAKTEVVS